MLYKIKNSLKHDGKEGLREYISKDNILSYLSNIDNIPQDATVIFKIDRQDKEHQASGRFGQTIFWLLKYKDKGITALEVSSWALRLASYIFVLRGKYKLDIDMQLEPHKGGKHARYWIRSKVDIVDIIFEGKSLL